MERKRDILLHVKTKESDVEEQKKETEEQSNMDEDLSNIFGNMQTPTEGSRSHNMEKTFASPKPENK